MQVGAPEGRALYYPETFEIIAEDALETIQEGLKRGLTMMEVDFPLSSDTSGPSLLLHLPAHLSSYHLSPLHPPRISRRGCTAYTACRAQPLPQPPRQRRRGSLSRELSGAAGGGAPGYKDSSDIFIDVNIQLAIRAAGKVHTSLTSLSTASLSQPYPGLACIQLPCARCGVARRLLASAGSLGGCCGSNG